MSEVHSTILVGCRFTSLMVIEEISATGHDRRYRCRCDCGRETEVNGCKLKSGRTRSCGCWKKALATKHGCARDSGETAAYACWANMKSRCANPKNTHYAEYGGRGITVCERWRLSFEAFLADMGEPPAGMTIERKENSGNYEPGNCRWATRKEQSNNTRRNRRITLNGRTMNLKQWCDERGLRFCTILSRLRSGWSEERALSEPIKESHASQG